MKVRYGNGENKENNGRVKSVVTNGENEKLNIQVKKGFEEQPSLPELMPHVQKKVLTDFDYLIEKNPNVSIMKIFSYLISSDYFNTFKPNNSKVMQSCVKNNVYVLIKEKIQEILQNEFENIINKEGKSEKQLLEDMKGPKYIEEQYNKDVSKKLRPILEKAINQFVASKKENEQQNSKNKLNNKDNGINSKAPNMNKEELKVFMQIKEYTNNFSFLADQREFCHSYTGYKEYPKFQNISDYEEFTKIQKKLGNKIKRLEDRNVGAKMLFEKSSPRLEQATENLGENEAKAIEDENEEAKKLLEKSSSRLKKATEILGGNEEKAIEELLNHSKGRLNVVEENVLRARQAVLAKKRSFPVNDEI